MPVMPRRKTIARYAVVSAVLAKVTAGTTLSAAIDEVTKLAFPVPGTAKSLRGKKRTLYRWVKNYQTGGIEALEDKSRVSQLPTKVLDDKFIAHLKITKVVDPDASLPDVIRGAEKGGLIKADSVSRTTVWRAARKLNLPIFATKSKENSVKRRFSYAHRMQMVLCDGKHFRAGEKQRKRVVFTFLDDSTRKALAVVVGPSESKILFLRGILKVIRRFGRMNALFVDNGSGFIAADVEAVCARLKISLIHGTQGYPEGRGKIERFNQTIGQDLLRTFVGDPRVDPDYAALEMRCEHYITEDYNTRRQESLDERSPDERWTTDTLPLDVPDDAEALERCFVVAKSRRVSRDNVISVDGTYYEMPLGHAGRIVHVEHDLLGGHVSVLHEGRLMSLHCLDAVANSKGLRGKIPPQDLPPLPRQIQTAARISFDRTYEPITTTDGDYFDPSGEKE